MFGRKDVDAIFCARGGYGAVRMLDYVDWEVVKANPKVFAGYSDITTIHLALERRLGLVSFYGPVVVSHGGGLSDSSAACFWNAVENPEPLGLLPTADSGTRTLVGGKAQGRLAGGCLAPL